VARVLQAAHLVTLSKEAAVDGTKQGCFTKKELRSQVSSAASRIVLVMHRQTTAGVYSQEGLAHV
jgi:hypothetical protein